MRADAETEAALVGVLERFCSGFARRDYESVMEVCARDADLVVVTSEESVLRGPDGLSAFLAAYVQGPTTYSWTWDQHEVCMAGEVAWLLATGAEFATTERERVVHPYRMTLVAEKRGESWKLLQVHGSSPHQG